MALKSMTGFGSASARAEGARVTLELNSVNRKQLDIILRLPPPLAMLEAHAQKLIQGGISRGRISGTVHLDPVNGESAPQINQKCAAEYIDRLRRAAKKLNLKDDLSASMLLQIPGLLRMQTAEQKPEALFQALEKALLAALKKLNTMRTREGRALETDLLARIQKLETVLASIKTRAPQVVSNRRKKLHQTLKTANLKNVASDERLIKEIALFAERSDISEEVTRLASHLQQFRKIMRGGEPAGRALDFLAQELFRETNTIGSKANDLKITQQVVRFKTELERIREQVQNVE